MVTVQKVASCCLIHWETHPELEDGAMLSSLHCVALQGALWAFSSPRTCNPRKQGWSCSAFSDIILLSHLTFCCVQWITQFIHKQWQGELHKSLNARRERCRGASWELERLQRLCGYSTYLMPGQQAKGKAGRDPSSLEGRTYCVTGSPQKTFLATTIIPKAYSLLVSLMKFGQSQNWGSSLWHVELTKVNSLLKAQD